MDERLLAAVAVVFAVAAVLVFTGPATPENREDAWPATYGLDFDAGSQDRIGDEWVTGADVPPDPNGNGTVDWAITTTDRFARSGNQSGLYTIDGLQDDGTIWLTRSIPVDPGQRYRVDVSTYAYSEQESFNVVAHMVQYAGLTPPAREADFPAPDTVDTQGERAGLRQPLARTAGWDRYGFSWTTPRIEQGNGTIHVAVGLSVVWETRIAWPYDDIRVEVTPVDAGAEAATPD